MIKTIATQNVGAGLLYDAIKSFLATGNFNTKKVWLLAEKAYHLIQQGRMKDVQKEALHSEILEKIAKGFNLYDFVAGKI